MAFRLPRFAFLHAARDAGLAAITVSENAVAGFPKVRLIDGQHAPLAKFETDAIATTFDVNRGAAGLEAVDRLIIPAGHNLAGATTIAVYADDEATFAGPFDTLLSPVAVSVGLIDKPFIASSQKQYLRLTVTGDGAWEMGEFWLTHTRIFGSTTELDPGWADRYATSLVRTEFPSGITSVLQLGEPRRVFEFTHRWLGGTDLAIYDELGASVGYGRDAFWLYPPDDSAAVLAVEMATPMGRTQDRERPALGATYTIELSLIESLA